MENAAEALKMAGTVLIFVLAISIIILAFGQVRETSDTILNYKDRETEYISDEQNHYYQTTGTERIVGLETVIPSIFRAYLENYKIVFEGLNEPLFELQDKSQTGNREYVPKYTLDSDTEINIGTNERKRAFLSGILYRDFNNNVVKYARGNDRYNPNPSDIDFEIAFNNVNIRNCPSLYDQLQGATTITEYLGVYYSEDNPNKAEVNSQKKRIITYRIQ